MLNKVQLEPVIISRAQAAEVSCQKLLNEYKDRARTANVRLTIAGGELRDGAFFPKTPPVVVVDSKVFLDRLLPNAFPMYFIEAEYFLKHHDPQEKLTRADLIVEMLDIWEEALRLKLTDAQRQEIEIGMRTIRTTYTVDELGGIEYQDLQMRSQPCLPERVA